MDLPRWQHVFSVGRVRCFVLEQPYLPLDAIVMIAGLVAADLKVPDFA